MVAEHYRVEKEYCLWKTLIEGLANMTGHNHSSQAGRKGLNSHDQLGQFFSAFHIVLNFFQLDCLY
jgi:hypothetical protein